MTIQRAAGPIQYEILPAPAGGLEQVKSWVYEMLERLVDLQQQPMVQSLVFARIESIADPQLTRPAEGMAIFAAADVIGAGKPAGLYLYQGGAWKQLQAV